MHHKTINGTATGTLLSLAGLLPCEDIVRTALLAAIGAAVSFAVSWILQRLNRRR